jgi:hypothetical protein
MSSGSRWNKDYSNPLSDIDNSSKKKIHACFRQNTLRVTYFMGFIRQPRTRKRTDKEPLTRLCAQPRVAFRKQDSYAR